MTNVPPSRDPANDDSLIGFTRELKRWLLKNIDSALPAEVISHDRDNNRVRVRPIITKVDSNGDTVQREVIQSIPVLNLGGGGFFINFNLPTGQQGMVMSFDRDISLFLQNKVESKPNTKRMHSFKDGIFIPQQWFDYVIAGEDSEAMVIQNLDGSVKIALDETSIRLTKGSTTFVISDDSITANTTTFNIACTDFNVDSSTFTHNSTNIGDSHQHPQGPDSDGNTEQDTGGPF